MRIKLLFLLVSLAVVFAGCASTSTTMGRAAAPEERENEIWNYQLPNGVHLLVEETDERTPTSIQVWVAGGSGQDPKDKHGIAHFAEHMLFTGSLHVPAGKAEEYIEGTGGKLSGHTSRDFSYFAATIPGDKSLNGGWERAEEILYDMVAYPAFNEAQMEEQRKAILLEIAEREREPETRLSENLFAAAYETHPYKNPVTGTADDVKSLTRKDLLDYYRSAFAPSGLTVVVVGGMDAREVSAKVSSTFGAMKPDNYSIPAAAPGAEIYQSEERASEVRMPVKLAYAGLGWHICSADNPDICALEVLSAILGGGRGSRLSMELRERQGIVYDIKTELFTLREPGLMAVEAHLDPDNIAQFTGVVLREMDWLKDGYVPEAELDRAKKMVVASHLISNETAEGQAYALGYWATVYEGKNPGQYVQGIKGVTREDVRRAAQKYLGEGNYTLSTIVPEE